MNKQIIKEICLRHGYKLKEQPDGSMDLNAYVYSAIDEILFHANCENNMTRYQDPRVQCYYSLLGQQPLYRPKVRLNPQELTPETIAEMKAKINPPLESLDMQNTLNPDTTYKHLDDEVAKEILEKIVLPAIRANSTHYEPVQCCSHYPVCEHNKVRTNDPINPNHYKTESGVECADIADLFPFSTGSAIKYAWRAGKKDNLIQDLEKCEWFLTRALSNGEDSLFLCHHAGVLQARRLFAKLNRTDLPELNYELVSRILDGRLEYALTHIDDWLMGER